MGTVPRAAFRAATGLFLLGGLAACDNLGLSGEPEELRVEIEATGTNQLTLVTSTNWILIQDPGCNPDEQQCAEVLRILEADTTGISSPFAQTFRFTSSNKYFVEVYPSTKVTATLKMRVRIDGREWYNESRQLLPDGNRGQQETLQFVYQWQEPTIR